VANSLTLELAPSAARASSGNGSASDIGALRTAARVEVAVTEAFAGSDHVLGLTLETAASSSGPWRAVADLGTFQPGEAPATLEKTVAGLLRYARVTWAIEGAAPSFTFQVTGVAHVLYAEPKHVRRFGIQGSALEQVEDAELAEFCIVASTEADGYLRKGKKLPLQAWDDDLRIHASKIAVYRLLDGRGRIPTGPDDLIDKGFANAIKWLIGVGKGSIDPPGLVDATPETEERAYAVASDPPIEW
jgi:phage gp36-like protein